MAFAVVCKSCQARFLLNDDLLRRKVAGRVVTVRCRQCHAAIEVDASQLDAQKMAETPTPPVPTATLPLITTATRPMQTQTPTPPMPAPSPTPTLKMGPVAPKPLAPKPLTLKPTPSPPRPAKSSTLMGIGGPPRPAGATEMVALSPGLLNVQPVAPGPRGFPEPPPPPPSGDVVEELSAGDWEIPDTSPPPKPAPVEVQAETAPESIDDFIEELPPSLPPVAEEPVPSSSGIPTLQALAHHEEPPKPRADDFFANMNAAMNGGFMAATEAPTIDVSTLTQAVTEAPSIDLSSFDVPLTGKQTLPLFGMDDDDTVTTLRPPPVAAPPVVPAPAAATKPSRTVPRAPAAPSPAGGSLSPSAFDQPPSSPRPDSVRTRRNVVAPATTSVPPPPTAAQRRSGLAAPILVALAAAAGFLIWKRSTATSHDVPVVAEQAPVVAAPPHTEPTPVAAAPTVTTPQPVVAPAPAVAKPDAADDLTFQTAPKSTAPKATAQAENKLETPTNSKEPVAKPQVDAKPEPATPPLPPPVAKEEEPKPKPEPREPVGEPEGPFDRAAAAAALNAGAAQASACRKEGDPSGVASVVITFAPSGRVTSANISGPPFAGTPTGGCIAAALRKARVPPFEGERVTVSKTIVIQ